MLTDGNCQDKYAFHHIGPEDDGFPLKTTTTSTNQFTSPDAKAKEFTCTNTFEVELSEAPLDPVLFEVPAGFKNVGHISSGPPVPLRGRLAMAWNNFLRDITSLFR